MAEASQKAGINAFTTGVGANIATDLLMFFFVLGATLKQRLNWSGALGLEKRASIVAAELLGALSPKQDVMLGFAITFRTNASTMQDRGCAVVDCSVAFRSLVVQGCECL